MSVTLGSIEQQNPELFWQDRFLPNPIAQPEIVVSRINARHVAQNPTLPPDRFGKLPVSEEGTPQSVEYTTPQTFDWAPDPRLEQRILNDYLGRNHDFRMGSDHWLPLRTSTVRSTDPLLISPTTLTNFLLPTDARLAAGPQRDDVNLVEYLDWLRTPGILRGISSHSDGFGSAYGSPGAEQLESALGGPIFAWERVNLVGRQIYFPSIYAYGPWNNLGNANWVIMRTVWQHRLLAYAGQAFYIHDGCSLSAPDNEDGVPYDDPRYASKNNAESILFFLNGLAVVARSKVFNDLPSGFPGGVAAEGEFGHGMKALYRTDASDAGLNPGSSLGHFAVLHRKRPYFWDLLGDWTLGIYY
jgi:hypothetical protein